MSSALSQLSAQKYLLEILEGPDKGAQYQVVSGDIKIGRGDQNDVILHDPRCSREHAVLKITPQAIFIEDRGSSTGLSVDGQKGSRAFLSHGSKIKIGSTVFVFKKVSSGENSPATQQPSNLSNYNLPPKDKKSADGRLRFYVIVGVVLLGVVLLLNSNSPEPIVPERISIDEEIESSKRRQDLLMKEQMRGGKASRQYLDAQASYTKGLRDYREGLYKSAVSAFSAAVAIYPEHPTARRYLRLAQLKLDEQIQFLMQEGTRAMEKNRYQQAKSAFKNAMLLISDPENKVYIEARERYNECVLLLRESF